MTEQRPADNVVDINERLEDQHLSRVHGLIKTTAYIKDADAAKKRTANAERQARHRARKAEAGLAAVDLPAEVAEAIKEQGWQEWLDSQRSAPPREVERVVEKPVEVIKEVLRVERVEVEKPVEVIKEVLRVERVEVPVEVPAKLTDADAAALATGRQIARLSGWKAALLRWLLA